MKPQTIREAIRRLAGNAHSSIPINVIKGHDPPHRTGYKSMYIGAYGNPVPRNSGYTRRWVATTYRIIVGIEWLQEHQPDIFIELAKLRLQGGVLSNDPGPTNKDTY